MNRKILLSVLLKKILSILALFSSLSVNAQMTVTLSKLKNTSWNIERNGKIDAEDIYSFGSDKILWYSVTENSKDLRFTYNYYLTTTLPKKYDSSLVGKNTKGCYIVRYNPVMDEFIYYIIKTFDLSTGTMVLLPRSWEEPIGGMAKEIKYKLVK
jgi:hypothetical protein